MPQYINVTIDGLQQKFLQLDDGVLVPVSVTLSLEDGTLIRLSQTQLDAIRNPVQPSSGYPLPAAQVSDLKQVSVSNLPSTYAVNFPTGFACNNLPATYPLSAAQETIVTAIRSQLEAYTRGNGVIDANTLRIAQGIPSIASVTRTSIAAATTAQVLAIANTGRRLLKIYNRGASTLFLGIGNTNPSSTDFTMRMFSDDFYEFPLEETQVQIRGVWDGTSGGANITEGFV